MEEKKLEEIDETEIKEDMIIGINEEGKKQVFYKLLEFDGAEDNKHYVAYTDYSVDEYGNYRAYGSEVVYENEKVKLEPIVNEKVWNFIEIALKTIQENNTK